MPGHYSPTPYGFYSSVPRPPGLQSPPPYRPASVYSSSGRSRDSSPLRPAKTTKGWFKFGASVIFLIILAQAFAFIFFYDLPSKLGEYGKAAARMREQRGMMNDAAKHLESERIALRGESNRLENERLELELSTLKMEGEKDALEAAIRHSELERSRFEREKQLLEDKRQLMEQEKEELREEREKWEKAREDRVPQGAFWGSEPIPAWDCRAYGKREYWATLENIPEDWTDVDACMNMPVEIKGVDIRRPDRCDYVGDPSRIRGIWTVNWGQTDCQPKHQDITGKVSLGKQLQ